MELSSEEIVTRLLSEKSILRYETALPNYIEQKYNLGDYLADNRNIESQYGERYLFVR